jgi:hypothetical protein
MVDVAFVCLLALFTGRSYSARRRNFSSTLHSYKHPYLEMCDLEKSRGDLRSIASVGGSQGFVPQRGLRVTSKVPDYGNFNRRLERHLDAGNTRLVCVTITYHRL